MRKSTAKLKTKTFLFEIPGKKKGKGITATLGSYHTYYSWSDPELAKSLKKFEKDSRK